MFEIYGVPSQALFGQLLLGLINGSFYALLSLGLAIIFGMLNIINFTHGAQYMLGAFAAFFLLQYGGLGYWPALVIAPIIVGFTGVVIERLFLQWLYKLDHLYGLLLTFGLALIIEGVFRNYFGPSGLPYQMPEALTGGRNLGFMFLPNYRAWTKRWQTERPGKFPTMVQAGVYSGVTHYLKAVTALKSAADGKAVVAKMKETPTDDPLFGKGSIRADGRKVHDAYLLEVKAPSESKYPGDFYKLRATIPAAEAFRPLKEGSCPLVSG